MKGEKAMVTKNELLRNIDFLGHVTFQIKGSRVIYTDPYQLSVYRSLEAADIILVSHSHFDHCSLEDIAMLCSEKTSIVAPADCLEALTGLPGKVMCLSPNEETVLNGVEVRAVPAYNIGKQFHPKESRWNGYVFTLDGVRYYHPGDSDVIPEMNDIAADVVFLPVGGTYTMDAREACEVANRIGPKVAIPMHYGSVIGSIKDAEAFVQCVGDIGAILPQRKK
jgi:L-ascorbate metabolism protein UlaG (beta-lactamase superfamily)